MLTEELRAGVKRRREAAELGATEMVDEHPVSAATLMFGLGFGVGLAVAGLLTSSRREVEEGLAQRLGRQMMDAMAKAMPQSMK